jgi:putative addiction module component (TIGR02574 family)
MTRTKIAEIALKLPPEEQLELAQTLWDNVSPPDDFELTPELRELLNKRRAEARATPEAGVPWEEIKARILREL